MINDHDRIRSVAEAAALLATIKLWQLVRRGTSAMSHDEMQVVLRSLWHAGPLDADWRTRAWSRGVLHEPEAAPCRRHTWDNADLVGRCMSCGRPLPEEPRT